jgi:hypothetical protein
MVEYLTLKAEGIVTNCEDNPGGCDRIFELKIYILKVWDIGKLEKELNSETKKIPLSAQETDEIREELEGEEITTDFSFNFPREVWESKEYRIQGMNIKRQNKFFRKLSPEFDQISRCSEINCGLIECELQGDLRWSKPYKEIYYEIKKLYKYDESFRFEINLDELDLNFKLITLEYDVITFDVTKAEVLRNYGDNNGYHKIDLGVHELENIQIFSMINNKLQPIILDENGMNETIKQLDGEIKGKTRTYYATSQYRPSNGLVCKGRGYCQKNEGAWNYYISDMDFL